MNEKFVKVEVLVDTTNPEQLGALGAFLSTVGGVTVPIPVKKSEAPVAPDVPAEPKPAQTKKRNTKPAEPAPTPEAPAEEETKPETPAEVPAEKKEYKIEEVREKLKEKVNDHREAIKAKLTELGAPNVSSLDPDNYAAFMGFLNGLK